MSERDLFANFERMRREMDELFGDVFGGGPVRRGAFTPAVDVYYVADPPRAVVRAELAGVRAAEIELEIRGRELVLSGSRRPQDADEWRKAMEPYWRDMIATGEFPRLAAMADTEWTFLNEDRFEVGLGWILDGIAARYER